MMLYTYLVGDRESYLIYFWQVNGMQTLLDFFGAVLL